ncbi:MAG: hypothetical protein U0939_01710 [Pirellulales bacterium]
MGAANRKHPERRIHRRNFLRGGVASLLGFAATQASSRAAANEAGVDAGELARSLIPFEQLTPPTQDRLRGVVERPTLHRRLPVQVNGCDPDLYVFFLRHPEVVVNMWQLMGITTLSVRRTGAYSFDARDGVGTQAKVELIYGTPDTHVYFADGAYEGPLLKRRTPGRAVLVLKSGYTKGQQDRTQVTSQLDAFLQLDQTGAEVVVRTLQPLIGKTADHNFGETLLFVSRVSQAVEKNATGVQRLASRLNGVEPSVREKFVTVATAVNHRATLRQPSPSSSASLQDEAELQTFPASSRGS